MKTISVVLLFMFMYFGASAQTDTSIINFIKTLDKDEGFVHITDNINELDSFYCYKMLYEVKRKRIIFYREECEEEGTLLGSTILSNFNN